jgi:hypothetical protein
LNEKQEILIPHPIHRGIGKKNFLRLLSLFNNGQEEGVEKENAKWRDSKNSE